MSAVTEADNYEMDAELLAAHNVIDGLSLVIAKQQAVMRQALGVLEGLRDWHGVENMNTHELIAIARLREALEGKQ